MARETLSEALTLMFGHEGGYSNNPKDPGGPTKYGITHKTLAAHRGEKSVTAEQVKALGLAEATEIYRKSYWIQSGGDLLPVGIDYMVFDTGVNSGPSKAVKMLQGVVGVTADGVIGARTVDAVKRYQGGYAGLIKAYSAARLKFMRSLTTWGEFGKGWTKRVNEVQANALRMIAGTDTAAPVAPGEPAKANPKDTGITETLKKPEAWGPLGGLLTALTGFASGNGPIQWALAAVMVMAVGYGIYRLVRRDRKEA